MAKGLFGKETPAKEAREAKMVKSGKMSPKAYAKGEKSEGEKGSMKNFMGQAKKMKAKR